MKIFLNLNNTINFITQLLGRRFLIIFLVAALAAILESFGVVVFIPAIVNNFFEDSEKMLKISFYFFEFSGNVSYVIGIFISALLLTILLKAIFLYLALKYLAIKRGTFAFKMRMGVLNFITFSNYEIIEEKGASFWINLIGEHSVKTLRCYNTAVNALVQLTLVLVYILFAFSQSIIFGFLVALFFLPVVISFKRMNSNVHRLSKDSVESLKKLSERIDEICNSFKYLSGIKSLKNAKSFCIPYLHTNSSLITELSSKTALIQTLKEPLAGTITLISLWFGVVIFDQKIVTMFVAIFLLYRGLNAITAFQSNLLSLNEIYASLELIKKYLMIKQPSIDNFLLENKINKLTLSGLEYKRQNDKSKFIFDDIVIKKGEIVAITGPSGVGKSTLLNLITGIISPTNGSIKFFNNNNMSLLSSEVRIGYVTQDPAIFSGTIKQNIQLFDKDIDNVQLKDKFNLKSQELLSKIGMDEFCDTGSLGLDYEVGIKGYRLSGGQRQRLALLRELYEPPPVLLLDEFTSAQDSNREKSMIDLIKKQKNKFICIIVTHKSEIIKIADKVIKLKQTRAS